MNANRLLLNLHLSTQARMARANLPMGVSRTKWINDAICEKLDRDQPQTIGILAAAVQISVPAKTLKGPYVLKYQEGNHWRYSLARRQHQKLLREKGMSPGLESLIEQNCIQSKEEMTQGEKDSYMEGVIIPPPPIPDPMDRMIAAKEKQALDDIPLVNVASPAMEDPADFWGDEDEAAFRRIRAKACKA